MANSYAVDATRVMLVAKYPVLRHSLREIVEREADLAVVAEARDLEEAVIAARALQPDVIVLDASLAREDGIAALRGSRPHRRAARVVCISITCDREHVLHALRAGACGFLRSEDAAEDLVPALRLACTERPFFGEAVDREEIMSALAVQSKTSLLMIEGDGRITEETRLALETAGYEVLVAHGPQEALELVRTARPDGILLEVNVPSFADEFHFIWELRKDADSQIRNTPVLVVTSADDQLGDGAKGDGERGLWEPYDYLPVQGFVSRPLLPEHLLEKVRSLVSARGAQ